MNLSRSTVDAILCARMGSSRLPGKIMLPVAGRPMLQFTIERLRHSSRIARLVVATSNRLEDDAVARLCDRLSVPCYRGSVDDVVDRVYRCARHYDMAHIAFFGGDNPLIDPSVCDEIIGVYLSSLGSYDYVTNNFPPTYPDGQEVEVTSFQTMKTVWLEAKGERQREHLLTVLWDNPQRFRIFNVTLQPNLHHERWTLDFPEDYKFLNSVVESLYPTNPMFGMQDVIDYLNKHPELREINAMHSGYYPWLEPRPSNPSRHHQ